MKLSYVLAAMGIHPVCPGDGMYQLTSPVFGQIEMTLDAHYHEGETFVIVAENM